MFLQSNPPSEIQHHQFRRLCGPFGVVTSRCSKLSLLTRTRSTRFVRSLIRLPGIAGPSSPCRDPNGVVGHVQGLLPRFAEALEPVE